MTENTNNSQIVTIILIVVGALVIFPMFFMGFGMMGTGPMMGGMWGDGTTSWMFIAGIVMQLLFLAALLGGGYLVYRAIASSENDSNQALEELRVAYARGNLTDDEYEQRRETLERDT